MLKLSSVLSGWAPAASTAHDEPLILLGAAWTDIAGPEIARNSHPARIAGTTLYVTTRSSAWSQQLSFLTERILTAIRTRLPRAPIDSLRFRVGQLPTQTRLAGGKRVSQAPPRRVQARPPAKSAEEAVARFREDVAASRRAKRAAGWNECAGCAALIAPGTAGGFCVTCASARARHREATTAQLLFEAPWLGYAGTAALVEGLNEAEYDAIRAQLLARWWEMLARARAAKRLSRDGRERLIASSYVLLRSGVRPEDIVPATLRSVLGDELNDLLYGMGQRRETNVE